MMHFFRKNDKTTPDSAPQEVAEPLAQQPQERAAEEDKPVEEAPIPNLEKRVREEARRLRLGENLLSAPHLQRVQDNLRLSETKLQNIEDNLERTRKQKELLRRYKEIHSEMSVQQAHLYEVHKLVSGKMSDKKELERFETFESVQGRFQRLQILERERQDQKARSSSLASALDEALRLQNDELKLLSQRIEEAKTAQFNLKQGQGAVLDAQKLEGFGIAYEYSRQRCMEYLSQTQNKIGAIEKSIQEKEASIEALTAQLEKHSTRLQSTEGHRHMAKHAELIVECMNRLLEIKGRIATTETEQREVEQRQRTADDLLGRVFSEFQQLNAQISTLKDELHVHRQSILGQNSYQLQERTVQLRRRRQMLQSALALWKRISSLYVLLEDKLQEINTLRLKQEHTAEHVRELESRLGILRRESKEKEYTFTLSKSQNVIQLRSDLKEGTSCTVCGATHHPYHSDTMLEQNKLIGELKSESELLNAELRNKEAELLETRLQLERISATKRCVENELINLRSLQNEAVKDWSMFQELDSTFRNCDSTTNAEARTAMLRQLIENMEGDVQKAQDELDTHNFHQGRINELNEKLGKLEQTRGELTTRMNEVNTGCQVLIRDVERIQRRKQHLETDYANLFEKLDKLVSIPDWHNTWKRSHEGITMHIQEMAAERRALAENIQQEKHQLEVLSVEREGQREQLQELRIRQKDIEDLICECNNRIDEAQKEIERLLGSRNSKQYGDLLNDAWEEGQKRLEAQKEATGRRKETYNYLLGKVEELQEESDKTDELAARERSLLDIWIRQYNASHPPVQYAELANFFEEERDWSGIREEIRRMDMDAKLTQARVDQLRNQLVALQAEGNIPDGNITDALLILAKQEEVLEKRRRETMMLIAASNLTLQAHEKAEALIKEEKMREA